MEAVSSPHLETATFGGGCFWCLEAVFELLKGVVKVQSGYAGGNLPQPTYEQVCGGVTGHAEVVQVTYDPRVISYGELLEVFFAIHDPTTLNRQGNDRGTQYRSAIYFQTPEQKAQAEAVIARLTADGTFPDPIVTEVAPLGVFYPAEEYHEAYFRRHPGQPYCEWVIGPKVMKFKQKFAHLLESGGRQ
ncbi:MAG: peptide-methionine (S)-S-oxide reductase MsrA [Sulfuricellaceae bacterium]